MLAPVQGLNWGYRNRSRLGVKDVLKRNQVLIGFRERSSPFIADIESCAVLPPAISALLKPLRRLVESLSVRQHLPQIEVAVGDADTVLLLRILQALTAQDIALLDAFATEHKVVFWLQTGNAETLSPLHETQAGDLHYTLPEFGLRMPYKPQDFTQVNSAMNRTLVSKALRLLDLQAGETALDLFCGLGNFTLAMAKVVAQNNSNNPSNQGGKVVGIEGSDSLVTRALNNALANDLNNVSFGVANLFEATAQTLSELGAFDKWLIDPPREGAQAVCEALVNLSPALLPKRMVYVSCNPATLARDAGILVNQGGWRLLQAGVANMFPHTAHVESIAVFAPPLA